MIWVEGFSDPGLRVKRKAETCDIFTQLWEDREKGEEEKERGGQRRSKNKRGKGKGETDPKDTRKCACLPCLRSKLANPIDHWPIDVAPRDLCQEHSLWNQIWGKSLNLSLSPFPCFYLKGNNNNNMYLLSWL